MENRLAGIMEKTNEGGVDVQVDQSVVGQLELKVKANDLSVRKAIKESEDRVLNKVQMDIKGMVKEQLIAAEFDPDLTAGTLTTLLNTRSEDETYAYVTRNSELAPSLSSTQDFRPASQEERRERNFWECRESLRL